MTKRMHFHVRDEDKERLDLIRHTFGVSKSAAFRAALAALSRQMGFEKELPPDFMKKNNT